MVAAIALVHRKTTNPKYIAPGEQVKVTADESRMRLVKMDAVKPSPKPEEAVSDGQTSESEGKV